MPLRSVVTIDGPAGAGKSTLARMLAEALGWRLLDTGAMYRAVALAALRCGLPLDDASGLGRLAERLTIELPPDRVLLDGEDVTLVIRAPEVSRAASRVAACSPVRTRLVACQRAFAAQFDTVTEGRDQGTVVFPDAGCKFYLVASAAERASRRHAELIARGQALELDQVRDEQLERDTRDAARAHAPMHPAPDALIIDSTDVPIEQILALAISAVRHPGRPPWSAASRPADAPAPLVPAYLRDWGQAWSNQAGRLIAVARTPEAAERVAAEHALPATTDSHP